MKLIYNKYHLNNIDLKIIFWDVKAINCKHVIYSSSNNMSLIKLKRSNSINIILYSIV
jgi:hypothetical protein